ncbi:FAD-binding oxidoreductase [bacterium]|nr:FAD-binding oxidoreductase [bacterium]
MKKIEGKALIENGYKSYLSDESKLAGFTELIIFPESKQELSQVIGEFYSQEKPFHVSGARTGIVGGGVPNGAALISTVELNKIIGYERSGSGTSLQVEPGVTLEEIDDYLKSTNYEGVEYRFNVDVTEKSATIGGVWATNGSGARSFMYGPARKNILSCDIVLPSGQMIHLDRGNYLFKGSKFYDDSLLIEEVDMEGYSFADIKNNAGFYFRNDMPLLDLFIGSEGLLGIAAQIELRLYPATELLGVLCFLDTEDNALDLADQVRSRERLSSLEYFGPAAIILLKNLSTLKGNPSKIPSIDKTDKTALYLEYITEGEKDTENIYEELTPLLSSCGGDIDRTWTAFDSSEMKRLKDFRHALPEAINTKIARLQVRYPSVHKMSTDMALPSEKFRDVFSRMRNLLSDSGLEHYVFGHLGDFHLHINIIPNCDREIRAAYNLYNNLSAIGLVAGGTISAEHGVGVLKKKYLPRMYSEAEIGIIRRIKRIFDPKWLLNRGVLIEP